MVFFSNIFIIINILYNIEVKYNKTFYSCTHSKFIKELDTGIVQHLYHKI